MLKMTVQYKTLCCKVRVSSFIVLCGCSLVYRTLTVHWALTACWIISVYWVLAVTCTLNIFTHRFTNRDDVKPYNIYGVTIGEVEVDLLTGQHQVSCFYIGMVWGGLYCCVLRWTVLLCVEVCFIVMCWGVLYCSVLRWTLLLSYWLSVALLLY